MVSGNGITSATEALLTRETDSLVLSIVNEVAAREGVEPAELPPLEHSVDTDALVELGQPRENGVERPTGTIEFPYLDYSVIVSGDGVRVLDSS